MTNGAQAHGPRLLVRWQSDAHFHATLAGFGAALPRGFGAALPRHGDCADLLGAAGVRGGSLRVGVSATGGSLRVGVSATGGAGCAVGGRGIINNAMHINVGTFTDKQSISDLAHAMPDQIMHSVRLQGVEDQSGPLS
jgi:hypothetical protein